jgi:hypothetical protein
MNPKQIALINQIIDAARNYISAVEESTKELGAPDMSPEEREAFLTLQDRLYLYESFKQDAEHVKKI